MKTWRDRCSMARDRGWFIQDDRDKYAHPESCMAGEVAAHYGVSAYDGCDRDNPWSVLWDIGDRLGWALYADRVDEIERGLEEIEDTAHRIKVSLHE